MTEPISLNTQAILLLTAPLLVGPNTQTVEILSLEEYNDLAEQLGRLKSNPAALLTKSFDEFVKASRAKIDSARIGKLLGRGFQLSQALERWRSRAIWVISRADAAYPKHLKNWLGKHAPAVLYGCGDLSLLQSRGLAILGSPKVKDDLLEYARHVGELSAASGTIVITGGSKGIEQAAMQGVVEQGGSICSVLADLERQVMVRENRNAILNKQLVLCSPFDPSVGSYEIRNSVLCTRMIFAMSKVTLIVQSDFIQKASYEDAQEQLRRLYFSQIYVRTTGEPSKGLAGLQNLGAQPWPEPKDVESFNLLISPIAKTESSVEEEYSITKFTETVSSEDAFSPVKIPDSTIPQKVSHPDSSIKSEFIASEVPQKAFSTDSMTEALYQVVKSTVLMVLSEAMSEREIAKLLGVNSFQMRLWLAKMLSDGELEKMRRPVRYYLVVSDTKHALPKGIRPDETPTDLIIGKVRILLAKLLINPKSDKEIAKTLGVTNKQMGEWLQLLMNEGAIQKSFRPVKYYLGQPDLFSGR